jgi:aryl-alcohol dehydrogenase-like predicted oxidoreductase
MTIEARPLGHTGTDVTILGYGAMELRGAPRARTISDEEAGQLLRAVLDAGINLIDTSVDYGRSEELIGQHVSHRRDDLRSNLAVAEKGPLPADLYEQAKRRLQPAPR